MQLRAKERTHESVGGDLTAVGPAAEDASRSADGPEGRDSVAPWTAAEEVLKGEGTGIAAPEPAAENRHK
jgi:hypothetical protein